MMFGLWKYVAVVGGFLAILATMVLKGRSMERVKNDRKVHKEYKETRKRMDEADVMGDPDAAREWLKNRGKKK
jgi:hypothetical protein